MRKTIVLFSMIFLLSGCGSTISQSEYDALSTEKTKLAAQVEELNSKVAALTAENEKLTSENENLQSDAADLQKALEEADDFEYNYCANVGTGKFHKSNCSHLPGWKNQLWFEDRQDCIDEGFVPCKICNP